MLLFVRPRCAAPQLRASIELFRFPGWDHSAQVYGLIPVAREDGVHFIVGGGVRGGRFYGRAPQVSVTSSDQVGQGRLLSSTPVDELSSTLGVWFDVAPSELTSVAPNIGRFASPDLGVLTPAPSLELRRASRLRLR